jgi:Tfp pilus assembly protein PilF
MTLQAQRSTNASGADSGGGTQSGYWIFSPLQDMTFVLLTPLPILLAFAAARRTGWMDGLLTFGLALAMAHYLPGILRAYGDRALFRRFRLRLIVAPLFLITITTWFAYLALHSVILLALLWGQWHWMMQVYGFARIYDAKVKPGARTPAWLDQMMCLLWFGMCVFVLNNDLPSYVTSFYQSGGPPLPAGAFAWFARAWLVVTVVLTLFYVIHTWQAVRDGRPPNPLKFVFIAATFLYLRYTVSVAERPLMGLVMFESWHDIQYLAIVWLFNLNRARKSPEAGPFIRFLFRPRAFLVLAYVGMCLAFGSLTHAWSLFKEDTVVRIAISIVTATGLLHYYLDGFIWKIREKETRQALGVRPEGNAGEAAEPARVLPALPALIPAWTRHAALWLLFLIPAALFFLRESESKGNAGKPLQIYQNVVEAFPDSPHAHYQIARELQEAGRLREARIHFERALELAPDLLPAHIFLGVLLGDQGNLAGARPHFERALSLDPKNAEVHNDLGIVLEEQGDLQSAKAHLERAINIDPQYALAQNNLGIVLAKLEDLAQARVHHERAVHIDPDFADAHYQLGVAMAKQGDLAGAVEHLERALRIDPNQHLAHNSLGEVLVRQGKLSEAKAHFEQALQIRPNYASAKQNLATTETAIKKGTGRQ